MGASLIPLGFASGLVQFTVGVIELSNGQIVGGNIMLGFSLFCFMTMWADLLKPMNLMPANTADVTGFVYTLMAIYMICFSGDLRSTYFYTISTPRLTRYFHSRHIIIKVQHQ